MIQKQLNELKDLIKEFPDEDYSKEYTIIFNTLLALENIRLFKLMNSNN
jgi:hypothetical protein